MPIAARRRVLIPLELPMPPAPAPGARVVRLDGRTMGTTWQVSLVVSPSAESPT